MPPSQVPAGQGHTALAQAGVLLQAPGEAGQKPRAGRSQQLTTTNSTAQDTFHLEMGGFQEEPANVRQQTFSLQVLLTKRALFFQPDESHRHLQTRITCVSREGRNSDTPAHLGSRRVGRGPSQAPRAPCLAGPLRRLPGAWAEVAGRGGGRLRLSRQRTWVQAPLCCRHDLTALCHGVTGLLCDV